MPMLLIIPALAIAGLTVYVVMAYRRENDWFIPVLMASLVAAAVQFLVVLLFQPTLGFFCEGTWASLIVSIQCGTGAVWFIYRDRALFVPSFFVGFAVIVYFFSSSECLHNKRYRELIGPVKRASYGETFTEADQRRIRLVPKETALVLAKKVLGSSHDGTILGSQLEIDEASATIQIVEGELWWIFPLDFSSYFTWQGRDSIPGYIRVKAYDPLREAELVDRDPKTGKRFALRYTRGAYFGSWLERRVYWRHPRFFRDEIAFEVDDQWRPWYVVPATVPAVGFSGRFVRGVILVDPVSGAVAFHTGTGIPDWIEGVVPLDVALERVNWWGTYVHGWWNARTAKRDLQAPPDIPGGQDLWFVESGGQPYWFTGMSSTSSRDQSLVGCIMLNTRTGATRYLPLQGTDEVGVMQVVDASLGADASRWEPAQPIPYTLAGTPTWVLPIISNEGIYQKVALVDMGNINNIAIDRSLPLALERYRGVIARGPAERSGREASSPRRLGPVKVLRVGDTVSGGVKTFYLLLEGQPTLLYTTTGESAATRAAALVRPGDLVVVEAIPARDGLASIESIAIKGIQAK